MKRVYLLLAMMVITWPLKARKDNQTFKNQKTMEMKTCTVLENKALIKKLYNEALNKRDFEMLKEIIAEDYTGVDGRKGVEAFKEPAVDIISAIPDIQWKIQSMVGEGDWVFAKLQIHGTHTGQYLNIAPTGKSISISSVAIYQLKDDRIIRSEVHVDRLAFLQQIEVIPEPSEIGKRNDSKEQVVFIDKFLVPEAAESEFVERMSISRNLIKTLPGFIEDAVYKDTDEGGNRIYLTIAKWDSEEALNRAKEVVQAAYRKEDFNPAEMMRRANITMDRRTYKEVKNNMME